jgi:UDP-N-acetylglucosamine transferase subunit ALG13
LIFVTVGAQMPFDRLITWVDDWASEQGRNDIAAQIGPTDFAPKTLEVIPFMDPKGFRKRMVEATGVVAHAGMGTILTALELGKPILVVPRLGDLNETRNDHQVATAKRLAEDDLILAAYSEAEFAEKMLLLEQQRDGPTIAAQASDTLLSRLREFTLDETWPPQS